MKPFLSKSVSFKKKKWMIFLALALFSSGMDKNFLFIMDRGVTNKVSFDHYGPNKVPLKMLYNIESTIEAFPFFDGEIQEESRSFSSWEEELASLPEDTLELDSLEEFISESSFKVESLDLEILSTLQEPLPTISSLEPTLEDSIWHISYIPWFGAAEAPENGEIGLWADGWFIAHRHTPNGAKIASFINQVEVDGQIYVLDDTWISTDLITSEEVARIRARGGITFQTCIDESTNQMVHYAPISLEYPYIFVQYPYTIHDTSAIGYWPDSTPSLSQPTLGVNQKDTPNQPGMNSSKPEENDFELFEEEDQSFQMIESFEENPQSLSPDF